LNERVDGVMDNKTGEGEKDEMTVTHLENEADKRVINKNLK